MYRLISRVRKHWRLGAIALCGVLVFNVESMALADRGGSAGKGGGQPAQAAPRGNAGGGQRSAPRASAPRQSAPRSAARPSSAPRSAARPSSAPRPQPNVNRSSGSSGGARSRPSAQRAPNSADIQRQIAQQAARERDVARSRSSERPATSARSDRGSNSSSKPGATGGRPSRGDVLPNVNGGRSNSSGRNDVRPPPSDRRNRDVRSGGRDDVRDPSVIPNVNRPSLNKPTRDAIDRGDRPDKAPNVNDLKGDKPDRDRSLGGAKPGEAIVKPVNGDPEVLQGFKPDRLNGSKDARAPRSGGGGLGSVERGARDPEVVAGLRNRDVRNGKADARERVVVERRTVVDRRTVVKSSSCGHSFCGGHGRCVYAYDYHDPITYCGSGRWYDDDHWGFSFSFGYVSSNWGFSVGYNNWYDDCNYYRPVYSCYRPVYPCYDYYAPYYYYRPYYSRPYYSLRYSYGGYFPRYTIFSSYNYAPYPRSSVYWWLYDDDDDYYGPNYYGEGYNEGFASGYEAGMENADDVGGYQPTWLAGGAASEPSTAAPREVAPSNDGWDLLVAGDVREARRAFDRETLNAPDDGLPQIGYAITAGLMERYDEAVAAMRKAARDDPDSFSEIPRDVKVVEHMRVLLTHYRNVTRDKPDDIDGLFMSAALRHLMGEDALAYFAVSKAIEAGDKDESVVVLKVLIQRTLDAQPEADAPAAPQPSSVPSVLEPATPPSAGQPF